MDLDESDFYKSKTSKSGLRGVCISCCKKYRGAYSKQHSERYNELHRIYRKNNKEHYRKKSREYQKRRNDLYPWENHYYSAQQRCTNPKVASYKAYGGRGIKFLLTMDQMKQIWIRDCAEKLHYPCIDRINGKGNYEASNVRFIESRDNARRPRIYN
jgi:hypothetical protein